MSGQSGVRAVNGDGARCGCGSPSALHVIDTVDYFLCRECSVGAVVAWVESHGQERFGPAAHPEYADQSDLR